MLSLPDSLESVPALFLNPTSSLYVPKPYQLWCLPKIILAYLNVSDGFHYSIVGAANDRASGTILSSCFEELKKEHWGSLSGT